LSLRQSGTFFFNYVRFSALRAENRTQSDGSTSLPQAKMWRCDVEWRNCVSAIYIGMAGI